MPAETAQQLYKAIAARRVWPDDHEPGRDYQTASAIALQSTNRADYGRRFFRKADNIREQITNFC